MDHRVHETVQKTTTRVDEGASVLYKVHCETISEKSGHASYFKSTQPISVVTNLLYIILDVKFPTLVKPQKDFHALKKC